LLLVLPVAGQARAAQVPVRTNLQLMQELLRKSVIGLLDSVALPRSVPLILEVRPTDSEEAWFVQTQLLQELGRDGFRLLVFSPETAGQGSHLILRVDELAVDLHPANSASGDTLRREVRVQLSGWLKDRQGQVVWGGLLRRSYADRVDKRDVPRVEDSPYEFTYAHRGPSAPGAWKVLESLAMGVAFGIVTYLFYSYRTR